jgi:tetratricopeptide (TPR) repeat protein
MGDARGLPLIVLLTSFPVNAQNGVPGEFAGRWVCQSGVPGYNLPIPGRNPSTERMTTPPSTLVITFSLRTDGTYEAPNASGRYVYDAARDTIEWLDGLHRERFSKTHLSRRSNGAPALSLTANKRYFGCFLSDGAKSTPGGSARQSSEPVQPQTPAAAGRVYTHEEFLELGREGGRAYKNGDLKRAQAIFEQLVAADPNSSEAQAALGAVLVSRGQDSDALVHLDRALQLNPEELSAYVNRGEAYLKLGRRAEAEADLKKAIALDPAGKNASANRARALLRSELRR